MSEELHGFRNACRHRGARLVEGDAHTGLRLNQCPAITVRGNRSLDPDEKRLKAVRVIVSGKNYDIYPNRIVTN